MVTIMFWAIYVYRLFFLEMTCVCTVTSDAQSFSSSRVVNTYEGHFREYDSYVYIYKCICVYSSSTPKRVCVCILVFVLKFWYIQCLNSNLIMHYMFSSPQVYFFSQPLVIFYQLKGLCSPQKFYKLWIELWLFENLRLDIDSKHNVFF